MAHVADSVIGFVVTTLTGLTTTGTNVFRQRVYDIDDGKLPALCIYMGSDIASDPDGRVNITYIDSVLSVAIDIKAKDRADLDGALLDIRAEVEAALSAAYSSRPASVIDYWWASADDPETSESDTRKGSMRLVYNFHYRRAQ